LLGLLQGSSAGFGECLPTSIMHNGGGGPTSSGMTAGFKGSSNVVSSTTTVDVSMLQQYIPRVCIQIALL